VVLAEVVVCYDKHDYDNSVNYDDMRDDNMCDDNSHDDNEPYDIPDADAVVHRVDGAVPVDEVAPVQIH
jgi:hypothetical protein